MERLTKITKYPLTTFKRCQICGYESDDICEFRLWYECDNEDKPEPYNILIACQKDTCFQVIKNHPRLYFEPAWSTGEPGHLMLLCSDCPHRREARCTHPNLRINGGEGLILHRAGDLIYKAYICYHDDTTKDDGLKCGQLKAPFVGCAGLPQNHPYHIEDQGE